MTETKIPAWATLTKREGKMPLVVVDTDAAYPAILEELHELGTVEANRYSEGRRLHGTEAIRCELGAIDCYWLEVAYQVIKLDVQRFAGFPVEIHFKDPEKKWSQKKFPQGRGAAVATQGKEARQLYVRLRGALPS